jgi:hypothetical protein
MTCYANDYPYGHAGCCSCKRDLDLSAGPSCLAFQQGNLDMFFYYCDGCFSGLQAAGLEAGRKAVGELLKLIWSAPSLNTGFAMISSLLLQAHAGDLVRAYEIGIDIPRPLHDAIMAGHAEVAIVPIFDWEA